MSSIWIYIFVVIALAACSAFFSGTETALFSLNRARLLEYREQNKFVRQCIVRLMRDYHLTLISLILGNMFVNTAISLTMNKIIGHFSHNPILSVFLSLFISLIILLICGEVTPKTIAILNPEKISDLTAPILWYYRLSIMPLILTVEKAHSLFWKIVGRTTQPPLTHNEYYAFVDMAKEVEAFNDREHMLLKNILELNETKTLFLVKRRMNITCVNTKMSTNEVVSVIKKSRQKFLPIITNFIDDSEKILSARDFFRLPREKRDEWARQNCCFDSVFVPEQTILQKATTIFAQKKISTCLVVDEHGGVTGMLCKKNLYESIVGNIREEFEEPKWKIRKSGNAAWIVNGKISPWELNALIPNILLPPSELSDISAITARTLQKPPEAGDSAALGNCIIKVLKIQNQKITELELILNEQDSEL
jgi:CBS domain containing-hemolysin-like protein